MFGLDIGNSLIDFEGEINLQTIRRAIEVQANEDARRSVRFVSIASPDSSPADILRATDEYSSDTDIEVTERNDHIAVSLRRTIRRSDIPGGQRDVEGDFAMFPILETDIWTAVSGLGDDFFERGIEWVFQRSEPDLSAVYVNSIDLKSILDSFRSSVPVDADIRIERAVAYNRKDEGTISFERSPYEEVFHVSRENDKYVDKIDFVLIHDGLEECSAFLSRDGTLKFKSGNFGFFFDHLLTSYARIAQSKAELLGDKERSRDTGELEEIRVRFDEPVFRDPSDHDDLISALSNLSRSSLSIFHRNPYAHFSVLDFTDGSSCDVFITENDCVTIIPSYRGSLNSLMRISEQISREFDEGTLVEEGPPEYSASDFFAD